MIDDETETSMNLLHLLASRTANDSNIVEFFEDLIEILYEFPEFDINHPASIESIHNITAAHIALQWQNIPILQALIKFDCDLLICDSNGQNAQDYAEASNQEVIINIVKEAIFQKIEKRKDHMNFVSIQKSFSDIYQSYDYFEDSKFDISSIKSSDLTFNHKDDLSLAEPKNDKTPDGSETHSIDSFLVNNIDEESEKSIQTQIVFQDNLIELIEQRYPSASQSVTIDEHETIHYHHESSSSTSDSECDNSNDSKSIDDLILKMSDGEIYQKLNDIGFDPGPINQQTRKYYQRKISRLAKNLMDADQKDLELKNQANYNIRFDLIRSKTFPFKEAIDCEALLTRHFLNANNQNQRKCFVYLLLDPRVTKNLPVEMNFLITKLNNPVASFENMFGAILNDHTLFQRFVSAIFYIGKGQSNRQYQHFVEAYKEKQNFDSRNKLISEKAKKIWSIWTEGLGPISLHFFFGITTDEALTREALLIETISLFNLTNKISGTYRCPLKFNTRQRHILGTYLLFKFFIVYLLNGERQINLNCVSGQ